MAVTPKTNTDLRGAVTIAARPGKTFCLDDPGMIDGKEAVRQAIYLILSTERYAWLIHSWNYGVELHSLIGQDPDFCIPEIERCVREALLQDDRITAVDDFSFEKHKKSIAATFTVHTIYGDIESETEVTI